MKKALILLLLTCISLSGFTQTNDLISLKPQKTNSIYLELGGNSFLYSLNYDKLFRTSDATKIALGAGLEYLTYMNADGNDYGASLCLTPAVNLLFGKASHNLETGVSLFLISGTVLPAARIGYRYQPVNGGFLFRIGFTPIITTSIFIPWGGISLGYTF